MKLHWLLVRLLFGPVPVYFTALAILVVLTNAQYFGLVGVGVGVAPRAAKLASLTPVVSVMKYCDIFRGEWVPDREAPYYNHKTCHNIQEHQNCLKYGRPDLGFLKWRWRPSGCELPRFDPHQFLQFVRDKSLAFVGDSLARNHMQSLLCLLSQGCAGGLSQGHLGEPVDPEQGVLLPRVQLHHQHVLVAVPGARAGAGGGRPRALGPLEPVPGRAGRVVGVAGLRLRLRDGVGGQLVLPPLALLREAAPDQVQLLQPAVQRARPHALLLAAPRVALKAINDLDRLRGRVIVRMLSPMSHFENGTWDHGGDCRRAQPMRANETVMEGRDLHFYNAQMEEYRAAAKAAQEKGRRLMLMDATAAMLMRPDGHPSRYGHWPNQKVQLYNDCIHWCLPGPIDIWNDMLFQMILA